MSWVYKFLKYWIILSVILLVLMWLGGGFNDKEKKGESYYLLSRSDQLPNGHPMYKQGYRYSCVFKDTDPNAKIKYMDFYYKGTCPEYRNK